MKKAVLLAGLVCALFAACTLNVAEEEDNELGIEKISVTHGALPVYKFTLPEGTSFGDYNEITAQFSVDDANYSKTARARAYGNYLLKMFVDKEKEGVAFLDFGNDGEASKNGPYLVSDIFHDDTAFDEISGKAGAGKWFTLKFPLEGKRYNDPSGRQSYHENNFPAADAQGVFYFAVGLGTGDTKKVITYYVKEVVLRSNDGSKQIAAMSGFTLPAFVGYTETNGAIPKLVREVVAAPDKTGSKIVTFDKNEGDAEASPYTTITVTAPKTTVGTLPTEPVRTGYDFSGWNTQKDGHGTAFTGDTPVTESITVYAQWGRSYTVTFYKNEGGTEVSPYTTKDVDASKTTIDALPTEPTRDGYKFAGWNTKADGSGVAFTASVTVTENLTVYAQWIAVTPDSYTVTFDKNGGTGEAAPASKTVTAPNTIVVTLPTPPTRSGYTFADWNTKADGHGDEFTASTPVTEDITVYAQWTAITYKVTFDKNGGNTEAIPASKNVTYPDIIIDALPTEPVRTGYTFTGWNTQANGTGAAFTASIEVKANITVYAQWVAVTPDSYTVTFDKNGGNTEANPTSKTTAPATAVGTLPTQPTRTGYTFTGWNTQANGGGTAFTDTTPVTATITVYAQWTATAYTVTFDKNGGTGEASPTSKTVTHPATTVGTLPTQPTRTGYTFGGWNTKADGTGATFTAATAVTASLTVYAQWNQGEITVNTTRYQQVKGFGGMGNWGNPTPLNTTDIDKMYGPNGLGYNIFRIILHADAGYNSVQWRGQVDLAKRAQSYGAIILASVWSPPAGLKSNNDIKGGKLLPENYAKYAEHLKSFVQYMNKNGVTIDVISLQNEPDYMPNYDSCEWTGAEMRDFVKGYGHLIGNNVNGVKVKIIPGESFQFRRAFTDPILNDSAALQNFDIIGGHIYGGGLFSYPLAEQKGKEVWMTEHLLNNPNNYAGDKSWSAAMTVAKEIHDCMDANFNAYIWWYLKRFYGMMGDGQEGSVNGAILPRGYVLSHYAKYATGKQRVGTTKTGTGSSNVLVTAYEAADSISLVIINRDTKTLETKINLPVAMAKNAGEESSETGNMRQTAARLSSDGKTAIVVLAPQSVVSLKFEK